MFVLLNIGAYEAAFALSHDLCLLILTLRCLLSNRKIDFDGEH